MGSREETKCNIDSLTEPVLELVYRIYTDEQYESTSREKVLAQEILDYL